MLSNVEKEGTDLKGIYSLLKPYVRKHYLYFSLVGFFAILAAVIETAIPVMVGRMTDQAIPLKDRDLLLSGFIILLLLAGADWIANFGQRFFVVRFSSNVIFDLRQAVFVALQNQELDFYARENVGQIMARSIEEIFSLRDLLTWALRISFLLTFLFITAFVAMLGTAWELALIFIVLPVSVLLIIRSYAKKNQKIFYNARYSFGELSDTLAQNLEGIQTVKSFGREAEQLEKFNLRNQDYFEKSMKTAGVRAFVMPGMVFIISLTLVFLVFVGGYFLSIERVTVGAFVTFMLIALNISIPGRFIGWIGIILQDGEAAAQRLGEIFDAKRSINDVENSEVIDEINGDLTFESVSFRYDEDQIYALQDINLHIPSGQRVAILGVSGAGKSTLINLVPRFYEPTSGRVLIDGMDIRTRFKVKSLRSHIGIVHQDSFLFTQTIHENIAFGKIGATREEVVNAAKAAQIHDFIKELAEGYDTIVGERGVTLSGGQRQRITIARTLLEDPKILIFDDSVSAVDPNTEARIQANLELASKRRTTIVISQRPSSLKFVDRIVVIDKGEVVQDGNHKKLVKMEGIYRDFIDAISTQVKFMDWDQTVQELSE